MSGLLSAGCAETKEIVLYLQDLKVEGASSQPPIHITKDAEYGQVTISPHLNMVHNRSIEGQVSGHTKVNGRQIFQVDTIITNNIVTFRDPGRVNVHDFTGSNLTWKFPSVGAGLDVDLGIGNRFALFFGGTYSTAGKTGLYGYRVGLGYRSQKASLGFRLDAGWQWEEMKYSALTIVTERPLSSSASTVAFYEDEGVSNRGRFFASMTFNGVNPEWTVNPFFQAAITRQTIFDFQPHSVKRESWAPGPYSIGNTFTHIVHDLRGEFTSTIFHVTPGIYFDLTPDLRALAGMRIGFETQIENSNRSMLITSFFQIDFTP